MKDESILGDFRLYFHGETKAKQGKIGKSAATYILETSTKRTIVQGSIYLKKSTRIEIEYTGLIEGLKKATDIGVKRLYIYGDSLVVIKQLTHIYTCKSAQLLPYYKVAKSLLKNFEFKSLVHIHKSKNEEALNLTNLTLKYKITNLVISN